MPLPEFHYKQVQAALNTFETDFLGAAAETVTTTDKADAISSQAKKFLRDFKGITKRTEVKLACENLIHSIDKGVHTPLPNEIRKLNQQLQKKHITYGQIDNLILLLAKKYDAIEIGDDQTLSTIEIDANIAPEIVLSETFID